MSQSTLSNFDAQFRWNQYRIHSHRFVCTIPIAFSLDTAGECKIYGTLAGHSPIGRWRLLGGLGVQVDLLFEIGP